MDGRDPPRYRSVVPNPRFMKEDYERTRKDLRNAVIFGVIAATLEMAALLWFFR